MIRKFKQGDEKRITLNEFSNIKDMPELNLIEIEKYTLEDKNEVRLIIGWVLKSEDEYFTFLLVSNNLQNDHIKELRKFIQSVTENMPTKTWITYSRDCAILERWHEFLGFKKGDDEVVLNGRRLVEWKIKHGN